MQTWVRAMLLTMCTAIGIAVALAVALHKPASPKNVSTQKPTTAAAPPSIANSVQSAAAVEPAPVVAPYRDPVARQVGQLEESIQQLEESSHRRARSLLRAIAAIQNQIDESPRKPAVADEPAAEAEQMPPPERADAAEAPPPAKVLAQPRNGVR